jgi:DNA-binding transcriptional LysR family regulator
MITDDLDTVLALARQGSGIAALPDFLARRYAEDGMLVSVLPQWNWITGSLSFVYPSQPFLSAKVRAFIDLALDSSKPA